jgi:hypothetical protein
MGIFTYIKIGLAVAVFAILGYFVYEYKHMQTVIAKQQDQIANLKVEQEVQSKKQEAFDAFMAKKPVIQRRVIHEKAQIDKEVLTDNDADLRALYERYRLLPDPKVRLAPDGSGGRAHPAPRGSAGAP